MIENIENLKNTFTNLQLEVKNKFRLPIIITYSIILVLYNWDIVFYLAFQNDIAINKINFVKKNNNEFKFLRVLIPILIAIAYSIIFPLIQLILNIVLQYLKRINNNITRNEELDQAKHNFNVQLQLAGQQTIQQLQSRIDQLIIENKDLIDSNNSLISKYKDDNTDLLNLDSIYNSEYDKVSSELKNEIDKFGLNKKTNMIEVINFLENYRGYFHSQNIEEHSTFPSFTKSNLDILKKYKIIEVINSGTHQEQYKTNLYGSKLLKHFKLRYFK